VVVNKAKANANGKTNIYVENYLGTGSVTMNSVKADESISEMGIHILSSGNVSITGGSANKNFTGNLTIENTYGTGNVTITNGDYDESVKDSGIFVSSKGIVTITNVSAVENPSYGIYVQNTFSSGTPGVTIQNSGTLMNVVNGSALGVYVYTNGAVKLVNIEAYDTEYESIYIQNDPGTLGVTLTNIKAHSDTRVVIDVESRGPVTGSMLSAQGNSLYTGIFIDNCQNSLFVCQGSGNVSLSTVTSKGANDGLSILSNGAITISNLDVEDNDNYGAFLDNQYSSTSGGVTILKATAANNDADGIRILTKGNVVLDGITANGNDGGGTYGVYVDNSYGSGNFTLLTSKGPNSFNYNSYDGLMVTTNGTIALTNVAAIGNGRSGLNLNTYGSLKTVTITTAYLKNNGNSGIVGQSTAATSFTGVKVFNNGLTLNWDGINWNTGGYNFTITNSVVSGNGRYGMYVIVGPLNTLKLVNTLYFGNDHYLFGPNYIKDISTDGSLIIL
jgi:hypothetical protein